MTLTLRLFLILMSIVAFHVSATVFFGGAVYLYTNDMAQTYEAIFYINRIISVILFLTIGLISCYFFGFLIWHGLKVTYRGIFQG